MSVLTPNRSEQRNRSELAYDLIRQDILHGQLFPSDKLSLEGLSERYGIGTVPLKAKKEAEVEAEKAELAKAEAERLAREAANKPNDWRSRPKPWEVKGPGTWKTVIKPTGMTRTWVPTTAKKPPPGVGI